MELQILEVEFGDACLQIPANCLALTESQDFKHPVCLFRVLFFSIDQDAEVFVRWQWSNSVYNATFKVHRVQSHQSSSIHLDRVGWIAGILRIYAYTISNTFFTYLYLHVCSMSPKVYRWQFPFPIHHTPKKNRCFFYRGRFLCGEVRKVKLDGAFKIWLPIWLVHTIFSIGWFQPALTPPKFNIACGKRIVGRRSFPFGSRSLFVGELYVKLPAGIMGNLTAPPPMPKLHQKIRPY